MQYVRPIVVGVKRASKAISHGANGSNPEIKGGTLLDFAEPALHRSTSGAYQADE
jgi:hypothetical protein